MHPTVVHRRYLHRIPELGYEETKTHDYITRTLRALGFNPQTICRTSCYVYIDNRAKTTIGFRADIDGLPIVEKNEIDYASCHLGKMHACGHDGHTAILLGFAEYLAKQKPRIDKNLILIFQAAEEGPGGAKDILNSGILEKYQVKAMYGLHLYPYLPQNTIGVRAGGIMAQVCEFQLTIRGKSAHGAQPQLGVDSILVASQFVQQVQHMVSRKTAPQQAAVVTVGKIEGGTRRNIIAESVKMDGTARCFSLSKMKEIETYLKTICTSLELTYGCTIDFKFSYDYPPVINDEKLTQKFISELTQHKLHYEIVAPQMLGEDFSYYGAVVPSLFFFVGTKNEKLGYVEPLHSDAFNFEDEKVLPFALSIYQKLVHALG